MLSLFLMLTSSWMVFSEHKTELFFFLSLTEGTEVVVYFIGNDVWGAEYELTGALNDEVEI